MSKAGDSFVINSWMISSDINHCTISYHPQHKSEAFYLRDSLANAGFRVYVHSGNKKDEVLLEEHSSTTGALSAASDQIARSLVVVICFSESYKSSEFCKQEALRAIMLNKEIVLVRMYEGCEVDGWLSLAMGNDTSKCVIVEMSGPDPQQALIAAVQAKITAFFEANPRKEQKPKTPSNLDAEVKTKARDLWMAIQIGDAAKARRIIESMPEGRHREALLEVHGDDKWFSDTPLLRAARCGRSEAVEELLKLGAKITTRNRLSNNALHLAAGYGHTGVMKILLDNGGLDIDDKGQWGRTALHHAAAENHSDAVLMLVQRGANIEARGGHFERTPIGMAAHFGRNEIVNILCMAGANVGATDVDGETVLHLAATTGKVDTGRLLIKQWKAQVEATDFDSWTPLMTAAAEGQDEFVKMLLTEFHANCNAQTIPEGHTALHIASEFGQRGCIAVILDYVRERQVLMSETSPFERLLNFKNRQGNTPLHVACAHAALLSVEILLQNGANFRERNEENATPLALARDVAAGSASASEKQAAEEIIQMLRAKGASPEL